MQTGRLLVAGPLAGLWLAAALAGPAAFAQVTINNEALNSLGKPAHRATPHRAPTRATTHRPTDTKPAETKPAETKPAETNPTGTKPAEARPAEAKPSETKPHEATTPPATEPTTAALPKVPLTPPAILALPPPVVVPLAHPPPPPTIPVNADAPGAASEIKGGVRVTFGPDRADLNPATVAALREFARDHLDHAGPPINIYAYATGAPDDPSTPRRLSLERALAARAVLMDCGIPSPRIYPRALGPAGDGNVPDRVDVVAGAPGPQAMQGRAAESSAG